MAIGTMIISELALKALSQNKNKWAKTQVLNLQFVCIFILGRWGVY